MPGPAAPPAPSSAGLRELFELLNDALAATVTRRSGVAAAACAGSPGGFAMASLGTDLSTGRGRRRASRSAQPASGPQPEPRAGPGEPGSDGAAGVDAEHAEIWQLVRRAQDGDGEAFGQLYDRYVDVVFRFIYYRVNDRALAEDFTSETFLRALRRISGISYQGRDIGAWFVTIARNIVLDHVKSARNRLETPTADTLEGRERQPSTESAVLAHLQSEQLMAAVSQLGGDQRECVLLRFVQGMSVSETAQIMGKNDGAIKALQHRAVRKLADLVGNELR
ncbi:sigma-70 family RNA polymerase sigma factor [uncultured Jatrophihabitans sp.]|uniref:sigma-70 family RNA polymerase sigma factor n=1 Tax=uncultured Jatrophihabitans sp. TaxID=1610747 RepID=UPI0035CAC974